VLLKNFFKAVEAVVVLNPAEAMTDGCGLL